MCGVALNDSKNALGSRKDRHEKLGEGKIGLEALTRIVNHPALHDLPFYLETPNELDGYAREIAQMRALANEASTSASAAGESKEPRRP